MLEEGRGCFDHAGKSGGPRSPSRAGLFNLSIQTGFRLGFCDVHDSIAVGRYLFIHSGYKLCVICRI